MAGPARKRPAKGARKGAESKRRKRPLPGLPGGKPLLPDWLKPVAKDPAYGWAVTAWERAGAVKGSWFDAAKADRVVAIWPQIFRLTTLRFAGVPFLLRPWQEVIVRLLVGWKMPTEVLDPVSGEPTTVWVRLFRCLRLWIPRKNGKSEFLAALALLFWAVDGIVGGEGYVFARDETQAMLPFNRMKAMVANCDQLAQDIQPHKRSLYLKPCAAPFILLTGAEEGKHGKLPSVILGDEMHEWRSRKIETDLHQGTAAHLEPMELYASTAGLKSNATGVELWDESQAILDGSQDDPSTLIVIFAAGDDDDWEDEKVWAKANPSLGLSPTLDYLRREAKQAKGNPRRTAEFKCYHLNQWIESTVRWIPKEKWDACAADKTAWKRMAKELAGRPCYLAFDVSSTQDLTALVLIFPPQEAGEKWKMVCRFWVPADTLDQRIRDNRRVPFRKWVDEGALETTPGDYVDQDYVKKAVQDAGAMFDVQGIGFDPWNATKLVGDLQKEGIAEDLFVQIRQGVQSLGEPSKRFERLVFAGDLDHGGQPVMGWMAGNATIRFDENLNFMPAKKRSAEKIDGIVAAVMGIGLAMTGKEDKELQVFL